MGVYSSALEEAQQGQRTASILSLDPQKQAAKSGNQSLQQEVCPVSHPRYTSNKQLFSLGVPVL